MKRLLFAAVCGILSVFVTTLLPAQKFVQGVVKEQKPDGQQLPLPYASVYWLGSTEGTVTDESGKFKIRLPSREGGMLVASFVGYANDTLEVTPGRTSVVLLLSAGAELGQVEIRERQSGSYISTLKPVKTEVITTAGLQKLACCNLSESFENSATVDVGYADAVTGARQIQMLGLAGVYSQLMVENIPFTRGLGSAFGLTYIPGTWMESIQISKGTSSVINGYESTTGQINAEFRKPWNTDKFFLNLYGSHEGRLEVNAHASRVLSEDKLSTLVLAHASTQLGRHDMNHDRFLDQPLTRQINLSNRWSYEKHGVTESKFGFSVLLDEREGGQLLDMNSDEAIEKGNYVVTSTTRRVQVYDKTGFVFRNMENTSLGLIFSGLYYDMESVFGRHEYQARQLGFYGNAIFQSQIVNPAHTYNAGISLMYDNFDESYRDSISDRIESVPGVFAQYTFSPGETLSIIAGARLDQHSNYGTLFTPRFHFKVSIAPHTILRGSAGKGFRSASVLAENTGMLVSARQFVIRGNFRIEEAWNYGLNITQTFALAEKREAVFSADFYRTDFINQIIVDLDQAWNRIIISNLDGKSYSNSFQVNADAAITDHFSITAAYRLNDVRVTTAGMLQERALVSRHKGLLAVSYASRFEKWKADLTTQYHGRSRLPAGVPHLQHAGYGEYSPDFVTMHLQLTRKFKKWDAYAGVENLTNYMQHHPVLGADNPFEEGFDAGIIWGPVTGRMFYGGIRYTVGR